MFGQKRLSREGGIEIVVKELCTRMVRNGCTVTCYNRSGHHVSGAKYDNKTEYACDHPEKVMKLKQQAADFVCKKYNWDEVVRQTMKLYRRKS